jgi:hypothetical protein
MAAADASHVGLHPATGVMRGIGAPARGCIPLEAASRLQKQLSRHPEMPPPRGAWVALAATPAAAQCAPRLLSTAGTVLLRIATSCHIVQFLTYQQSSRTRWI